MVAFRFRRRHADGARSRAFECSLRRPRVEHGSPFRWCHMADTSIGRKPLCKSRARAKVGKGNWSRDCEGLSSCVRAVLERCWRKRNSGRVLGELSRTTRREQGTRTARDRTSIDSRPPAAGGGASDHGCGRAAMRRWAMRVRQSRLSTSHTTRDVYTLNSKKEERRTTAQSVTGEVHAGVTQSH